MEKRIALIGAGNIGSRHLQALARVSFPIEIYVVEPNDNAKSLSKERYDEVDKVKNHALFFVDKIEDLPTEIFVAIIATSSKPRREIIERLVMGKKVKYCILEKFLFPKEEDYFAVEKTLYEYSTIAYVNCSRRCAKGYIKLKRILTDVSLFDMQVSGSDWGLGCNAIHMLDLYAFLSNQGRFEVDTSFLEDKIYESKRPGYVEFNGVIRAYSDKGMLSLMSYSGDEPCLISIQTEKGYILIREDDQVIEFVSNLSKGNSKIELELENTSTSTTEIIEKLINDNDCILTKYEESMGYHLELLRGFIRKARKIIGDESVNECLVT